MKYRNERGSTLIELIVTAGLLAVVVGVAVPRFGRRPFALWTAQQQLLADFRATRSDALIKGDHFRLRITSAGSYEEDRLRLVGANWVPNATVRARTLPPGISFTSGLGTSYDFNTRGLMLNPGSPATLTLAEADSSRTRAVTVWPSGQVIPR